MKPLSMFAVGTALLVTLAACQENTRSDQQNSRNRFGYRGADPATQFATPTPTPDPFATPSPTPETSTMPTPMPTPQTTVATPSREISYGTPVPGKPGFVTSPHSPYAGYVDVRGFPPGTEVKCPYSGKIFLVP